MYFTAGPVLEKKIPATCQSFVPLPRVPLQQANKEGLKAPSKTRRNDISYTRRLNVCNA